MTVNFGVRKRSGVFVMVWPLANVEVQSQSGDIKGSKGRKKRQHICNGSLIGSLQICAGSGRRLKADSVVG
jgi:hypothetical protein